MLGGCRITGGFPSGLVVKNPPANAEDMGLIPGSGRSPGGGHGYPLQYSCLENPHGRGAWQATIHWIAKSWTWLNDSMTIATRVSGAEWGSERVRRNEKERHCEGGVSSWNLQEEVLAFAESEADRTAKVRWGVGGEARSWGGGLMSWQQKEALVLSAMCVTSSSCLVTKSCLTFCNPMDCNPTGLSVYEIL